jgi:hypothetical protein
MKSFKNYKRRAKMIKKCIAADNGGAECSARAGKFQDREYGKGMRVHNEYKNSKREGYRCPVCGRDTAK